MNICSRSCLFFLLPVFASALAVGSVFAATPGLPFTEDFSDTALQDPALTTANWNTDSEELVLAAWRRKYGVFEDEPGVEVGSAQATQTIVLGDADGDGDLDLLEGNTDQPTRLFLNNGSSDPFNGATGIEVGTAESTRSLALADLNGDGDLDLLEGISGSVVPNRLFLNNGTADPFNGVNGTAVGTAEFTSSLALGDVDGDGDLDLLEADGGQANRLFLNNGTADPFNGVNSAAVGSGQNTYSLTLGDVDGDGDLDLLAGNFNQANQLFLNNSTPNPFNGVAGITVGSARFTTVLTLGDVDGDGDLDLLEGNNTQANRLFLNNGTVDPFNGVAGTAVGSAQFTQTLNLGDLDGDGDLDLLEGNVNQANRLFLNNGTLDPFNGVAGAAVGSAQSTRSLALGDVDGDGDLDLLEGNTGQPNRLFLNHGTDDPFENVAGSALGSAKDTQLLALGDVDGDGDLDVLEGNYAEVNRLFLNNGTEDPFNGVAEIEVGTAQNTLKLLLGDFDGDGNLDLLEGNSSQANLLFLNNGTLDPFNGVTGTAVGSAQSTRSLALGDVDGDGDLDLLEGNSGETTLLFLNNGSTDPFLSVAGVDVGVTQQTFSLALGDIDSDGDLDLVQGNFNQANLLFLNNGSADPFNSVSGVDVGTAQNTWALALGDIDRDGDLDLLEGNSNQVNRLFLNNGTDDPFNSVASINISSALPTRMLALIDVDGDGDLDLLEGINTDLVHNRLFLNNGTTNPFNGVNSSNIGTPQSTNSLALGDIDGDGDLDLLEGNSNQVNRLFLSRRGSSPFTGLVDTPVGTAQLTWPLALGDVDGDGDLDLLEGNDNQPNRLFLNNGTADPFNGVTGTEVGSAQLTRSLALGDVDEDGDLDLLEGNDNQPNRLFLNNGTADPFNGVTGIEVGSAQSTLSLALGDVDGDGDLDLLEGVYSDTQPNRLFLNNGTLDPFNGVAGTAVGAVQNTLSLALGDLDGDGDLDLLQGNEFQANRLFLNNGTANPFNGLAGTEVGSAQLTISLALGDVDGDGDLDLLEGNISEPNRLFLNNGTADPFNGVTGTEVGSAQTTWSLVLGDLDDDGDLDLLEGNGAQPNRLFLNNGTADPFDGVVDTPIGTAQGTRSLALGDVDGDGNLDLLEGNNGQLNRLFVRRVYNTARNRAGSLVVDTEDGAIPPLVIRPTVVWPDASTNTSVSYYLSNNNGTRWYRVMPNRLFTFPAAGSELRWRAEVHSLSPVRTPRILGISLSGELVFIDGFESAPAN